jgi:hypothetical protein
MGRMRTRFVATLGLAVVLLAACGSNDNGESAKKGPQVAGDAANALEKAGAAHLTGSGTQGGKPMKLDVHVVGADASGTLTMNGAKVDLVNVGGKLYVRASGDFWTQNGVPASAISLLDGKWVIVPGQAAGELDQFSLKGLADELRNPSNGTIKEDVTTGTVDGQKVVVVTESDGSTLDVAATGKPYPLRVVDKGSQASTINVSDFGKKTAITAPSGALDLSQLSGG